MKTILLFAFALIIGTTCAARADWFYPYGGQCVCGGVDMIEPAPFAFGDAYMPLSIVPESYPLQMQWSTERRDYDNDEGYRYGRRGDWRTDGYGVDRYRYGPRVVAPRVYGPHYRYNNGRRTCVVGPNGGACRRDY